MLILRHTLRLHSNNVQTIFSRTLNMKKFTLIIFLLLVGCKTDTKDSISKDINSSESKINEYLELREQVASYSGTVLVAQKDSIIHLKAYGLANRAKNDLNKIDTKFKVGSITKTFTALAILQLQEKNKLSIENTLSEYITDFPNANKIKIKHLLTHSSGIHGEWREDWHEKRRLRFNNIIKKISEKPLLFEPGLGEEYSNSGYALLAYIIEKVSGMAYEAYCEKHIFKPANMLNTGAIFYPEKEYSNFATGHEYAPGLDGYNTNLTAEFVYSPNLKGQASAYSTVEDLYNYSLALKNNDLLDESSMELLLSKLPNSDFTLGNWHTGKTKTNGPFFYFSGVSNGFEAVIIRYTDKDITIVALNNHQNTDVYAITRTVGKILGGQEIYLPTRRLSTSFDISKYRELEGIYAYPDDSDDFFEIVVDNEKLFISSNNDPLEELFLESQNKFFSKNYDLQLDFSVDGECEYIYNGDDYKYLKN